MATFRVWPDGTVQSTEYEPYNWMSDDYVLIDADNEEDAYETARSASFI